MTRYAQLKTLLCGVALVATSLLAACSDSYTTRETTITNAPGSTSTSTTTTRVDP